MTLKLIDGGVRLPGPLAEYQRETRAGQEELARGDLPMRLLAGRKPPDEPEFARWREKELARRQRLMTRMRAILRPAGPRAALMVMARWLASGRSERERQLRLRRFAPGEGLAAWLEAVASGEAPENAATRLADPASGARWQSVLEAMASAHPGEILALAHRRGLPEAAAAALGFGWGAAFASGEADWVCALVPAAARPHLAEWDGGVNGLVLLDSGLHRVGPEVPALFLRNLVAWLGKPELASRVHQPPEPPPSGAGEPVPWPVFAAEGAGSGLRYADCVLALRGALAGRRLEVIAQAR